MFLFWYWIGLAWTKVDCLASEVVRTLLSAILAFIIALYLHSPVFLFQFKPYQLTVGWPSVHVLLSPASHLLRFIDTCFLQPQASCVLSAAKLLCRSGGAVSSSAQEQKEADCRRKTDHCSGLTRALWVPTSVWQNVTHLNCARSMTPHLRLFLPLLCFLLFSLINSTQRGRSRIQGSVDRQPSDGGNFSLTVLLCVTAVLIANLPREGGSEKKGKREDRKWVKARKRHKGSEPMNPVVSPLQFDIWSREPISVRSLPLGSHFNKLLVFEWLLAGL